MSVHPLNIDVQKIAQDVETIRHLLNRIEKELQKSLLELEGIKIDKDIEKDEARDKVFR